MRRHDSPPSQLPTVHTMTFLDSRQLKPSVTDAFEYQNVRNPHRTPSACCVDTHRCNQNL